MKNALWIPQVSSAEVSRQISTNTYDVEGAAGLLTPRAPSAMQVLLMCSVLGCKCSLRGLQPKLGNPGPVASNKNESTAPGLTSCNLQSKNLRRTRLHYEPLAKGPGQGSWKKPGRWLKKRNSTDHGRSWKGTCWKSHFVLSHLEKNHNRLIVLQRCKTCCPMCPWWVECRQFHIHGTNPTIIFLYVHQVSPTLSYAENGNEKRHQKVTVSCIYPSGNWLHTLLSPYVSGRQHGMLLVPITLWWAIELLKKTRESMEVEDWTNASIPQQFGQAVTIWKNQFPCDSTFFQRDAALDFCFQVFHSTLWINLNFS